MNRAHWNTIFALMLLAVAAGCGGCEEEEQQNNTTVPIPGEGEVLVVDLGEVDMAGEKGVLPRLEEPFSAEETDALIDGFSWEDTTELAARDAEGRPALYYVIIYVDSPGAADLLENSGIYHDMLPLFGEERERWAGEVGAFTFRGNNQGVFAFAMIHGETYNTLRQLALDGEGPFTAIILRDPPDDAAVGDDGSLSYEYLAGRGFLYGASLQRPEEPADAPTLPSGLLPPASWARAHANLTLDSIDELRRAATEVAGFFGGRSDYIIQVIMQNTDDGFEDFPEPPMYSAWRRNDSNEPRTLNLEGASLRLQTDLWLADEPLDEYGFARLHTFDDTIYTVCIQARNDAVEVSEFLTPIIACHFAPPDTRIGTAQRVAAEGDGTPRFRRVIAKDYVLNIIAQMTDSRHWMSEMVGFEPRQARVLVGPLADLLGEFNNNRAFAACNGADSLNVMHGFLDGFLFTPLAPLNYILANDILFPGVGDDPDSDEAALSRGVPTHEYGHFAFCQLLHHMDYNVFGTVWSDISLTAIASGGNPPPDRQNLYVNEAIADWFTFQVAGGVNYFGFGGAHGFSTDAVYYCDPERSDRSACMESNIGGMSVSSPIVGTDPYDVNLARAATVMHDAFDGAPTFDGTEPQRIAGDGVWTRPSGSAAEYAWRGGSGDAADEPVALPPRAFYDIVQKFVWQPNALLEEQPWFDAIARVARDYGYTSEEVCQLFEIHAAGGDCMELVSGDALGNADAVPRDPFNLTGFVTPDNTGTWTWEDASYFATGYRYEIRGEGGGDVREGMVTETRLEEEDLNPNRVYTLQVWTVNNDQESPGFAEHRVVTYPSRPTITETTPEPGAISLTWEGTFAEEFEVEVEFPSGERRTVSRTFDTRARVAGLEGNTTYTFRVRSINSIGVSSPPSDPAMATTLPVTEIFVSPTGDDAGTGTAGDPVATLGVAVQRADDADAQIVRFEAGDYVEPSAVEINRGITLAGPATGSAEIRIQGLQAAPDCNPGTFNDAGRPTLAALSSSTGPDLHIRDLTILADDQSTDRDACVSALNYEGMRLTITRSRLGVVDGPTVDTSCAMGANLRGSGQVHIDESTLVGFESGAELGGSDLAAAGLCAEHLEVLSVRDSTATAFETDFPAGGIDSLYGAIAGDVRNLEVARTRLLAHAGTLGADAGSGRVGGLWAEVKGEAFIHNSVALTPNGGSINRGVNVEAQQEADVYVYHVTTHSGDRWGDVDAAVADHQGAALRIAGLADWIELGNNLFSHAAGFGADGWGAALNIADLDAPLCDFVVRGNAFSAADRPPDNGKSALVIREFDSEFGFITRGVDNVGVYSVDSCSNASQTAVRDNLEMYFAPTPTTPDTDRVTAAVDDDGVLTDITVGMQGFTQTHARLSDGGVPVEEFPTRQPSIQADIDGASRDPAAPPAVGAFQ